MIFADLEKRDLKASRLTCKAWNSEIPPLLFNSVFITARYADLEVADFVALTYGAFVETMVYSLEVFSKGASLEQLFESANREVFEENCLLKEVTDKPRYDIWRCCDDDASPFWRILRQAGRGTGEDHVWKESIPSAGPCLRVHASYLKSGSNPFVAQTRTLLV